jgi:hypothetical protein
MSDDRSWITHKIHQWGHEYNSHLKNKGSNGIESTKLYKSTSPGKNGKTWSSTVDDKRAAYHSNMAQSKNPFTEWAKMNYQSHDN